MRLATTLILLAACSGADEPPGSHHTHTGGLGYDVPVNWKNTNSQTHTSATSTWAPTDNAAKESVSVVWTAVVPLPTGPEQISDLLIRAEQGLPDAKVSKPIAITSTRGLSGFQVASDFTPADNKQHYHRVHAVLLDGKALVHVLYVAADGDDKLESYRLVLNSVTNEEG